jgi:hypothetical protein
MKTPMKNYQEIQLLHFLQQLPLTRLLWTIAVKLERVQNLHKFAKGVRDIE